MILDTVQAVLDTYLNGAVYAFWNQFIEIPQKTQSEYVIYSQSDSPTGMSADNKPLIRDVGITIRYYFDSNLEKTSTGRTGVLARADGILNAMENAGFETTTGIMFMGDIDSVGKSVAVMDFTFMEVQ